MPLFIIFSIFFSEVKPAEQKPATQRIAGTFGPGTRQGTIVPFMLDTDGAPMDPQNSRCSGQAVLVTVVEPPLLKIYSKNTIFDLLGLLFEWDYYSKIFLENMKECNPNHQQVKNVPQPTQIENFWVSISGIPGKILEDSME